MKYIYFLLLTLFICNPCFASIKLDGSTQYLNASSVNLGLNAGTEMSACAWINVTGPKGSQHTVDKISDVTNQWVTFRLQPNGNSGNVAFSVQNQALGQFPNWSITGVVISVGTHHVCFTWKANAYDTTDGKLYVDGTSRTISSFSASGYASGFTLEENSNDLSVGARKFSPVDNYFNGNFGELSIWKKQLTAGEITTLYNNGYARPCERISNTVQNASLVAYFPFDDATSGTVSGTPTNLGSATVSLSATGSPTWNTSLTCKNSQINNGQLNNAKIYAGSQ